MKNLVQLDKNMIVERTVGDVEVQWLNVREEPFDLYGLYQPKTEPYFHRLPEAVAKSASPQVEALSQESAGGRVRFSTDSPFVAIRATYRAVGRSPHLTLVSTAGFDLYIDDDFGSRYVREFRMPYDMDDRYEQLVQVGEKKMRSYTVHFPIHSVVETLEIGVAPGSEVEKGAAYRPMDPIVIYGSSIVHGTAASRPGLTYENVISRSLNMDFLNLGFSGNAKAEIPLAEYIATLPMSAFVFDYDHNAPNAEFLQQTHYPFYEAFRRLRPDVPLVMISRPNHWTAQPGADCPARRDVVLRSYLKAREQGDRNVYFIDGMSFFADEEMYDCTMDNLHPNDLGFRKMGNHIAAVLRHILRGS